MILTDRNICIVITVAIVMIPAMYLANLCLGKKKAIIVTVIYAIYAALICALYIAWRVLFEL